VKVSGTSFLSFFLSCFLPLLGGERRYSTLKHTPIEFCTYIIQAYISEGIFASLSKQEMHGCLAGISAIFL